MLFGNKALRGRAITMFNIKVGEAILDVSNICKNLGVLIDNDLRFEQHISRCIQKAYYNLKLLYANRYCLTRDMKILLCDALVLSNFNYCDTLYDSCLTQFTKSRIQRTQNSCLRFIFGIPRRQHISYKLKDANWLDMSNRRKLHSAVFYLKIIKNKSPTYLFDKINLRSDYHQINIRSKTSLSMPHFKTSLFRRSFSYNIVNYYNNVIPQQLKKLTLTKFKNCYKDILLNH